MFLKLLAENNKEEFKMINVKCLKCGGKKQIPCIDFQSTVLESTAGEPNTPALYATPHNGFNIASLPQYWDLPC